MAKSKGKDEGKVLAAKGERKPQPARGRGGKYNFPSSVPPEDAEDVRTALKAVHKWYMAGLKSRPNTDDGIEQRSIEYLEGCIAAGERPTVEKYYLAIGYAKSTIWDWEQGRNCSARRAEIIKKTKEFMAAYDAEMVTTGKLNPVPYIFRAKNYYGMADTVSLDVAPQNRISDASAVEVAAKYTALPAD